MSNVPVLVGDVGGTSIRLGLAIEERDRLVVNDFIKMPGSDFDCMESALTCYLEKTGARPDHALLALAGPVIDGKVNLINRPAWPDVDASALCRQFDFNHVRLVNDFAAMARSIPELGSEVFQVIVSGTHHPRAPMLVTGPGTGFGVATLLPEKDGGWRVISGEGGHAAYTPQTAREFALAELLRRDHDYVSNELVCSGSGLHFVHKAICQLADQDYVQLEPAQMLERAGAGDAICLEVCQIRARGILGAAADAALANGTVGGVILAGGVTQRLVKYLSEPEALSRFWRRGPRVDYMRSISITVLNDEMAPLIGAAALHFKQGVTT